MTTASPTPYPATPRARSRGLKLRISGETREFIIFSLWCSVTFVQFRNDELLLYPLALYYAWAVWRDQAKIAPLLARGFVLLLFPAWCLISPLWAVNPFGALKQAIYLILTMMICFQVAATMPPRRIFHALLVAAGTIGIINATYAFASGDLTTGIFAQKNFMGKYMVVLWAVAFAAVLDRGTAWWIRLAAVGLAGIAAVMAVLSGSVTAMLLVLATGILNLACVAFLLGGFLRASRIAALCFCFGTTAGLGALVLPNLQSNPALAVLEHFGKDTTLTGRTELWVYAEAQIAERPLLGVGAFGFWHRSSSPEIQKILEDFHKGATDTFNFHNSGYEIAVHQGLIGLSLATLALAWALFHIMRGAFVLGTMPHVFFLVQSLTVVARIGTESDFLKPFALFHMMVWIGALTATRAVSANRVGSGFVPPRQ